MISDYLKAIKGLDLGEYFFQIFSIDDYTDEELYQLYGDVNIEEFYETIFKRGLPSTDEEPTATTESNVIADWPEAIKSPDLELVILADLHQGIMTSY